MKIAIISAMIEEINPILKKFDFKVINTINDQKINYFKNGSNDFFVFNTGIGKVNGAITTSLTIKEYKFDFIVNIGTSGGIKKGIQIGDFVLADKLSFFDVDATVFNYEIGQVPREKKYLTINDNELFLEYIKELNFNIHIGTILTGDSFVTNKVLEKIELSKFDNPCSIEMESMAIVYAATKLNTKIVVLRTISDNAFEESNVEFNEYLSIVSEKYLLLFELMMRKEMKLL